jgi:hypothetical protein
VPGAVKVNDTLAPGEERRELDQQARLHLCHHRGVHRGVTALQAEQAQDLDEVGGATRARP